MAVGAGLGKLAGGEVAGQPPPRCWVGQRTQR